MPTVEDIDNNLQDISSKQSLLDVLIEIENVFDSLDLYAYDNWFDGEVVNGPEFERYWVKVSLMYPHKKMPNPDGGLRLTNHGCKVSYRKAIFEQPVKITGPESYDRSDGNQGNQRKAKMNKHKVWIIDIDIPRKYINDVDTTVFVKDGEEIDQEDLNAAYEEGVDEVNDADEIDQEIKDENSDET